MSYYWFNREKILQKAEKKYLNCGGKEKTDEYYQTDEDVLNEKARNRYINLPEEEKEAERQYGTDRYKKIKEKSGGLIEKSY